ncbi:hypothetical protein PBY51_024997 [Eleginops maclovinus]|uniref:Uncharacterized protein n=1 Tax=Eleginops maclovinus TaxID=56733 RepID=A0AAN7Y0H4_ELEMC|nr:hypothetical protein PBY51_024997 [Eleginops maclovinus]
MVTRIPTPSDILITLSVRDDAFGENSPGSPPRGVCEGQSLGAETAVLWRRLGFPSCAAPLTCIPILHWDTAGQEVDLKTHRCRRESDGGGRRVEAVI